MLSIIVCSRQPDLPDELKTNIVSTIGTDYELIVIDNSRNQYSIFSAYDQGLRQAKGETLCFMHEDLYFHTSGWGAKAEEHFRQYPKAGLLGVVGTHFLPACPAGWWDAEIPSGHFIQGTTQNGHYQQLWESRWEEHKATPTLVASIDGLWMCMPRKAFDQVSWDQAYYSGFHCYDADMSMQIWDKGMEVHILWDVLIEHKSLGMTKADYHKSLEHWFDKWKNSLPCLKGIEADEESIRRLSRIAELNLALRKSELQLKEIYASRSYRWSQKLVSLLRL